MLINELKELVGPRGWTTEPTELEPHLTEWRDIQRGKTAIMIAPASTDEVSAVVRACAQAGAGVVPQGGNTGLCGGAIPDQSGEQVLLSMSRLNRIRDVSADDFSMVVEAGCILADVQEQARRVDRLFPLSLAAEGSCQIGGNLSTNAGGINVVRYGSARQQVLGLEVVLADGAIWDGLRSLRKDNAGYDMKQIFLGSEGTLGVITAATLRLFPLVNNTTTAFVALSTADQAVTLLANLRYSLADQIQAFELISARALRFVCRHIPDTESPFSKQYPWYVLLDAADGGPGSTVEEALAAAMGEKLAEDVAMAKNSRETTALWRLRHSISEAQKFEGNSLKHDISVPIGRIAEFLHRADKTVAKAMPDARLVVFGHVGDGNLHYNMTQPKNVSSSTFTEAGRNLTELIYELVADMGGSISAEHGIGVFKKEALRQFRSSAELQLMQTLKKALDPRNTLNPGKVI